MGQTNTRQQPSPIGKWRDSLRPKTQEWDVRATRERSKCPKRQDSKNKKNKKIKRQESGWAGIRDRGT